MLPKPYLMVLAILVIWNILIFLSPFLESPELKSTAYSFFGYFCHQTPSRSISPSELTFGIVQNFYEFPVCTRDLAFYLFLMIQLIQDLLVLLLSWNPLHISIFLIFLPEPAVLLLERSSLPINRRAQIYLKKLCLYQLTRARLQHYNI